MTSRPLSNEKFSQAVSMHQQGRLAEAIALYRKALKKSPGHLPSLNQLGIALFQTGKLEDAAAVLQDALKADPGQVGTRYNRGTILQQLGRHDDAAHEFREAIARAPDDAELHNNLGVALKSADRLEEAVTSYRTAASLNASSAEIYINLATALYLLERFDESLVESEKALKLNPALAESQLAYGRALRALNRFEEAIPYIERSLAINPRQSETIFNWFILCLSLERFPDGWKMFDSRFSSGRHPSKYRPHSAPLWDGKPLTGTLAIWGEQGVGDQVLYASILPDVLAEMKSVAVEVDPRLIPLMARSFPAAEFRSLKEEAGKISAEAHLPIGSLGKLYRQDVAAFPRQAYLVADKDRSTKLRRQLIAPGKSIVGISWRSVNADFGQKKTADIQAFSSLFLRPGIQLVDLQYGDTSAEIASVRSEFGVSITHLDEIDNMNDLDGLAALIEACDAVVTISNTTAHIAGSLGKPVWILVPYHWHGQLWYWFKNRKDNLWYPEARICRQQKGQPWTDLIASVTPEILEFLQKKKDGAG